MIGGISVQPSEFVKIIYVFFVACILARAKNFAHIALSAVLAAAHVLILVASRDLGSALIFFVTYIVLLFVATKNILYLLSTSHFKKKEYIAAGHHYKTYVNTYLRGSHYTECMFMLAYSYYHQSPEPELDQTATIQAIERFQMFIEAFPYNEQTPLAKQLQAEMYEKLALRDLKNAQLYYDLGNYRGNNYRAAVVTAQNALNDYPNTKYKEDYSIIIVRAKYKEAINSVQEKLQQRSEDALDECYYFSQEYPETKHKKEIEKISEHLKRVLTQFEQTED